MVWGVKFLCLKCRKTPANLGILLKIKQDRHYYTGRTVLHRTDTTTQDGHYYTGRTLLHRTDTTTQDRHYYTGRTLLHKLNVNQIPFPNIEVSIQK